MPPERELKMIGLWCSWCNKPILARERRFKAEQMFFHPSCYQEFIGAERLIRRVIEPETPDPKRAA